jgi:hypothetical protein
MSHINIDLDHPESRDYTRRLYRYIDQISKPVRLPSKIRTLLAHTLAEQDQQIADRRKAHYKTYDRTNEKRYDLPFKKAPQAYKRMARTLIQINKEFQELDAKRCRLHERMTTQFAPLQPLSMYALDLPDTIYVERSQDEQTAFQKARNDSWMRLEHHDQAYHTDFKGAVRELTLEHILKLQKAVTPDTQRRLAHLGQRALPEAPQNTP